MTTLQKIKSSVDTTLPRLPNGRRKLLPWAQSHFILAFKLNFSVCYSLQIMPMIYFSVLGMNPGPTQTLSYTPGLVTDDSMRLWLGVLWSVQSRYFHLKFLCIYKTPRIAVPQQVNLPDIHSNRYGILLYHPCLLPTRQLSCLWGTQLLIYIVHIATLQNFLDFLGIFMLCSLEMLQQVYSHMCCVHQPIFPVILWDFIYCLLPLPPRRFDSSWKVGNVLFIFCTLPNIQWRSERWVDAQSTTVKPETDKWDSRKPKRFCPTKETTHGVEK